jgi:hypothetical protein
MAATATQQVLNNGARNLVLKYTIAGTSGDTTAGTLVDASALGVDSNMRLVGVESSLTGFSCNLLWDATANVSIIELPSDENYSADFSCFGGIDNNAGSGVTGDVLFTTTGYTASGDGGSIVLKFKKA